MLFCERRFLPESWYQSTPRNTKPISRWTQWIAVRKEVLEEPAAGEGVSGADQPDPFSHFEYEEYNA